MDSKALQARMTMQEIAKNNIRFASYNASVIVTVGGGKGKIMLDIANELVTAGKVKSILYVCDSTRLRDSDSEGFPAEIEKWGDSKLKKIITLECYQTTRKWEGKKFDLILGDEVDFAITTEYIKVFLNNEFKYKLLVSGTLSDPKREVLEKIAPIVYEFKTVAAEKAGVINKSEYYLYNYQMTDAECTQYNKLTKTIGILAAAGATFEDKDYMFWIRKRKHFLNSLESSYLHTRKVMKWLYNQNKNHRMVIFCELTPQADRVCKYSFHGKNEKDDNLTKFQNGEINALSVVAKIKRGINLKNADVAIFEGFSGSSTEWEQRNGRMKRLALTEVAKIIFLIPWCKKYDHEGEFKGWKPTVVRDWIERATTNISNIEFKTLKL
jgi:superfamily II DNA or RNA helicase